MDVFIQKFVCGFGGYEFRTQISWIGPRRQGPCLPSRKGSHGYGKSTRICGSFLNGEPGSSIAMLVCRREIFHISMGWRLKVRQLLYPDVCWLIIIYIDHIFQWSFGIIWRYLDVNGILIHTHPYSSTHPHVHTLQYLIQRWRGNGTFSILFDDLLSELNLHG